MLLRWKSAQLVPLGAWILALLLMGCGEKPRPEPTAEEERKWDREAWDAIHVEPLRAQATSVRSLEGDMRYGRLYSLRVAPTAPNLEELARTADQLETRVRELEAERDRLFPEPKATRSR